MSGPPAVRVDRERCVGTGACVFAAREVFAQDPEDGRVVLVDPHPPAIRRAAVEEAAAYCPVAAITLSTEAEGVSL